MYLWSATDSWFMGLTLSTGDELPYGDEDEDGDGDGDEGGPRGTGLQRRRSAKPTRSSVGMSESGGAAPSPAALCFRRGSVTVDFSLQPMTRTRARHA